MKRILKEDIVIRLVNAEWNKKELSTMPHRKVLDLAVTYHLSIQLSENRIGEIQIDNTLAEMLGLDEQSLFKFGIENTIERYPIVIERIEDSTKVHGKTLCNVMFHKYHSEIIVVSNISEREGAVALLYDEPFKYLAEYFQDDLYILPASVNEILVIGSKFWDKQYLFGMMYAVNRDFLEPKDRLSNNIYFFHRFTRKLECLESRRN